MYEYIKGKVIECTTSYVVLETNGVGYKIFVPVSHIGKIAAAGSELLLYISFIVRELSQTFYGFLSKEERELFETVLTVTGIGPKTGLSLVGHFEGQQLMQAVQAGDVAQLSKVPGIGKKSAERLIIELKTKLKHFIFTTPQKVTSSSTRDALGALMNLGYNQVRAEKAVQKATEHLPEDADLSQIIALALKY